LIEGNVGEAERSNPASAIPAAPRPAKQPAGEGIGLSIVKRLCDWLDASLEVTSPAAGGTMFKVVFPKRY
jgi:sensor histidine kinase regulating citrate/malate metabolism